MKTILLIEDDELLRSTTASFLEEEGYSVLLASNGLEGVELAMEHTPDLILCDITMPRMNGYEVFKILSENKVTSSIPLIYLSAKSEREDIRAGMQMGADDYITKPFDYDELLKAISLRIAKREKLMEASSEGFRTLVESTITGVFILRDEKIVYANTKLTKLLGYSIEDLKIMDILQLPHEDSREVFEQKLRRCLKGIQSNVSLSLAANTKSGGTISIEFWGGLSTLNGKQVLIGNIINTDEYKVIIDAHAKEDKQLTPIPTSQTESDATLEYSNPDNLSKREVEILRYICEGYTNQEIADMLFLSPRTVDTHRTNLLSKTGQSNTAALVVYAFRLGIFKV